MYLSQKNYLLPIFATAGWEESSTEMLHLITPVCNDVI